MRIFLRVCGAFAVLLISFFATLFLMDYVAPLCPSAEIIEFKAPFEKMGTGFAYAASAPALESFSDTNEAPTQSKFLVCENNYPMGPPHTQHTDITAKGKGRFSHYSKWFIFSASDNTDPNTNGRRYWAVRGK
jgi:hypothetical protein